jgi:hypothetical protein
MVLGKILNILHMSEILTLLHYYVEGGVIAPCWLLCRKMGVPQSKCRCWRVKSSLGGSPLLAVV